ncbi:hypothetical protein Q0F99_11915 [Rathayibacter oskolensis]|uniref:hypothetical protein n=1 Tax=Rathayibacter oskolensis TaxID=1891671 RepID=UPI00265D6D42|nr:hypothetical protein [Rathayibacter oskolensis]WKK70560.1 hypothetical protein Q0F99_11915 [Rathayibacter oskolensis]
MTGIDDDEVRWRMRSADPARALAPLTADELAAHLAAATGDEAPGTRRPAARAGRSRAWAP